MKKPWIIHILIVFSLLGSCNPTEATATTSTENIQDTVIPLAQTAFFETQTALPTETLPPPTHTVTNTSVPTLTLEPTFTQTPTETATSTKSACNQPLTSWKVPTTTFSIVNETKPKGKITLSISVLTSLGECGYLIISGDGFSGPIGGYSAFAFVDGEKDFTVSGSFFIKEVPYKIIVRND